MSTITATIQYINTNTFVPHENGNEMRFGLNTFGCDSIIQYNNDIWKFIWFIANTNNAVYINKDGKELIFNDYINCIRMQEA